jgi:hypothetical protein
MTTCTTHGFAPLLLLALRPGAVGGVRKVPDAAVWRGGQRAEHGGLSLDPGEPVDHWVYA